MGTSTTRRRPRRGTPRPRSSSFKLGLSEGQTCDKDNAASARVSGDHRLIIAGDGEYEMCATLLWAVGNWSRVSTKRLMKKPTTKLPTAECRMRENIRYKLAAALCLAFVF